MNKCLLSIFFCLLNIITLKAENVEIVVANDLEVGDFSHASINGVDISAEQNDGPSSPTVIKNSSGTELRIYAKGTFKVSSETPITFIKFELSQQGQKRLPEITSSCGLVSNLKVGTPEITWYGYANEIIFTVGEKSVYGTEGETKGGQFDFYSISVSLSPEFTPTAVGISVADDLEVGDFSSATIGGVTLIAEQNDGPSVPIVNQNTSGIDLRVYANGTLTINAWLPITKISFKLSEQGKKRLPEISCSNGTFINLGEGVSELIWFGHSHSISFTVGPKAIYGTAGPEYGGQFDISSMDMMLTTEYIPEDLFIIGAFQGFDISNPVRFENLGDGCFKTTVKTPEDIAGANGCVISISTSSSTESDEFNEYAITPLKPIVKDETIEYSIGIEGGKEFLLPENGNFDIFVNTREWTIKVSDAEMEGIDNIVENPDTEGDIYYDLNGVSYPQPYNSGIYIINGKKKVIRR